MVDKCLPPRRAIFPAVPPPRQHHEALLNTAAWDCPAHGPYQTLRFELVDEFAGNEDKCVPSARAIFPAVPPSLQLPEALLNTACTFVRPLPPEVSKATKGEPTILYTRCLRRFRRRQRGNNLCVAANPHPHHHQQQHQQVETPTLL